MEFTEIQLINIQSIKPHPKLFKREVISKLKKEIQDSKLISLQKLPEYIEKYFKK